MTERLGYPGNDLSTSCLKKSEKKGCRIGTASLQGCSLGIILSVWMTFRWWASRDLSKLLAGFANTSGNCIPIE